ncbi:GroES-like protein [Pyrenochaeta sp. DS3sAY3a]|nr:GroES-like protein [Pyrenochaeta sp. DS3sAY3a]
MKALILDAEARTAAIQSVPLPAPAPNELLVKVECISLNPIDPLYVQNPLAQSGRTIGSDFTGTITELGSGIAQSPGLQPGDRVAGFLQGACSVNERPGAFAEFLTAPADLVWKVPSGVSANEAAGVSLVALTAAQGIWYRLGLAAPFAYDREAALLENLEWGQQRGPTIIGESGVTNFFIYGASASVGLYAAQFIRISAETSGMKVRLFGAASKSRWDMLKAQPYGYDHLVDYRDQEWPEQIQALTDNAGVDYAYDCISEGGTVQRVASLLSKDGKMAIVRSRAGGAWKADNLPVEPIYGAVWEGLGEEIQYQGFTVKKSLAARGFAVAFYKWLSEAVGREVFPTPFRLMPGGLEKVFEDGFQLLGAGSMDDRQIKRKEDWMRPVSAEKIVYKID